VDTKNKKMHILDIAEEVFCHYGSKETTVRLIAHKAAINTAMLNYYFKSKENLFVILFERRLEQFNNAKKMLHLNGKSVFEELTAYLDFSLELIVLHLPFYKLMMKEKLANENEKIVALIDSYFKTHLQNLKRIVSRSIINKSINHKKIDVIDADTFVMMVSGFLVYAIFKIDSIKNCSDESSKIKIKNHLQEVLLSILVDD
jgi:TetR/AcrR family transcriptional regulator